MFLFNSHYRANASIISMLQRFSDLLNFYISLFFIVKINGQSFEHGITVALLISIIIFQMIAGVTDFYRSWRGIPFTTEMIMIIKNWTLTFFFMLSVLFLLGINDQNDKLSYMFFEWFIVLSISLILSRYLLRNLIIKVRSFGYNTRKVVIVGLTAPGLKLAKSINNSPWLGLNFKGFYSHTNLDVRENEGDTASINILGDLEQLIIDAKLGYIDKVYISLPMKEEEKIIKITSELSDTTCSVLFVPDLFSLEMIRNRSEEINGIQILSLCDTPITGLNKIIKRLEDVTLSIAILIFILPIIIIISLAIKVTSSGPIIFKQIRYGIDGRPIYVWKFRTMNVMENGSKVTQAKKNDSRLTSIGGFLRRTSLDELPQFINVLKGDMSIVGPRPHAVAHNEEYRKLIKGYMLRHKVKPGITGWAQVNGWRGETDIPEKMEKRIQYDLDYIRNWSVWFDIKIVFLTIFKGFVNKSAY
ncbi:MAG: undecaprenyl-phosphate glucose phosphotransferase [Pseudomonadota bacterium]